MHTKARAIAALGLFGFAATAVAHEKWFVENQELRWDLFFKPLPLAFTGAVLLAVAALGFWHFKRKGVGFLPGPQRFGADDERLSGFYGLVPAILAVHLAVTLLVNGVQGNLFSPDNHLPGAWKYFLGLAQTGIALMLFYGALARVAAVLLALLWVIGLGVFGLEPMLDNALYLGFAAFFYCAGRGPIAVDRAVFPLLEPSAKLMRYAIPLLRTGLGVSLIVVAFTEKLANMPLALSFLKEFPLNFTSALGMPMSDDLFILAAGSVELLVGLLLLFGIFQREIVLVAWIPINMTLTVFNWVELVGHLPIYGMMGVLLLWTGSESDRSVWIRGLREGPLRILPRSVNREE